MLGKGESIIANYRRLRFHTPMHPSRACGAALVQHCELITSLALFYERSTRTRYTARNARVVLCAFYEGHFVASPPLYLVSLFF